MLNVFRGEQDTIDSLDNTASLRGINAFDSLDVFCPLSITREDSPCYNATVYNQNASTDDCKISGPTREQRINCHASVTNYCAAVCNRVPNGGGGGGGAGDGSGGGGRSGGNYLRPCLDPVCPRVAWFKNALLNFAQEDPTFPRFDPPVDQLASSSSAGPERDADGQVKAAKALRASMFLDFSTIFFEGADFDPISSEWENAALCELGVSAQVGVDGCGCVCVYVRVCA